MDHIRFLDNKLKAGNRLEPSSIIMPYNSRKWQSSLKKMLLIHNLTHRGIIMWSQQIASLFLIGEQSLQADQSNITKKDFREWQIETYKISKLMAGIEIEE